MRRTIIYAYFLALLTLTQDAYAARILGLFPHTGKSHQMVFEPLLEQLALRGHHVTSVSFFPLKNPPANYTDVSLQGISQLGVESIDLNLFIAPKNLLSILGLKKVHRKMMAFHSLDDFALHICKKLVNWPQLTEAMRRQYDVVILEYFNSDCMLGLLHVHGIKAPIVAVSSSGILPWIPHRFGLTDNPSYVPVLSSDFTTKMDFWQRLENTFLQLYHKHWFRNGISLKEHAMIEKQFGKKVPDLEELAKNVSLILVNTHHVLNGVKPLLPAVVEVGGMHLDHTRKPLPHYIERFINESEHGVVLLSFGSLIKTATLPKYKEDIIVNACATLKQRVIWKYEESGEEGTLTGNILRVRWIPQFELLQHPKVLAFIAHGGLLGVTEAVSAGKPMVVVPFFGDQPNNAAAAEARGMAEVVSYADLNEKDLVNALHKVVSAEMRLAAKQVSKMWKDRIADPLDTAVYWTERVIRWGHGDPLHASARDMSFVELTLLDVAAAFLVAVIVTLIVIKYLLSLMPRLLGFGSKKQKLH